MKKLGLLISLLICQPVLSSNLLNETIEFYDSNTSKICTAYDNGFVCEDKDPVYYDNFKEIFKPFNMILSSYNKNCISLNKGYKCPGEDPVIWDVGLRKGVLVGQDIQQKSQIKFAGKYSNTDNKMTKKYYSMYISNENNWTFTKEYGFYKSKYIKNCVGYENGYICPGEEPVYYKNFRKAFDPSISYNDIRLYNGGTLSCYELNFKNKYIIKDGFQCFGSMPQILLWARNGLSKYSEFDLGILITNKDNQTKEICKVLDFDKYVQSGYVCKGKNPVVLKERPKMSIKNNETYYVYRTNILTNNTQQIACKKKDDYYYCPGESGKVIEKPISSNSGYYSKEAVQKREIINALDGKRIDLPNNERGYLRITPSGDIEIRKY